MAGYGMNAGIADAAALAWTIAAALKGWAPAAMLDAYEAERQPITEQVSHFAMNIALDVIKQRSAVPAEIELAGPDGRGRARAHWPGSAHDRLPTAMRERPQFRVLLRSFADYCL